MTTPTPPPMIDPRLVARVSDQFAVLTDQVHALGRDLSILRQQAGPIAATPAPPPYVRTPPRPPVPVPPTPPRSHPVVAAPIQSGPKPEPWWQRDGVISRLLAVAGAGVTLIGVVLLLVLAAQAGFFGPVPRVIGGALFAAALVAAGQRVYTRPGGRTGGIALAATGIAAGFLDVAAVTAIYHWLTPAVGLVVALAIAAGGVALATHWHAQQLALIVISGAALLAPFVTDGLALTLIGFLLVLQIAGIPAQLPNNWPAVHVARTVPVVTALLAALSAHIFGGNADSAAYGQQRVQLLIAALLVAISGIGGAILVTRRHPGDYTASVTLGIATLPLLACGPMFDRPVAALLPAAVAALLLALAAIRELPAHLRLASLLTSALALLQTCVAATDAALLPTSLLVVTLGYAGIAAQTRSRAVAAVAAGFAWLGLLGVADLAAPDVLASSSSAVESLDPSVIRTTAIGCAALVMLGWAARRTRLIPARYEHLVAALLAVAVFYLATAGTIAAGVSIRGAAGFAAAQGVVTISWMTAATFALGYGLRAGRNAHAALTVGLALSAAALAKLFLFDLAALGGLARVAAFLVVGLLLLGAGTRYARAFADRAGSPGGIDPTGSPGSVDPTGSPVTDGAGAGAVRRH